MTSLGAVPDDPRPMATWPAGPLEVRAAFDRPLDAATLPALAGRTIAFGDDRTTPRGTLRIAAATLADDGRMLVLATDPHPVPASYAVTLPSVRGRGDSGRGRDVALSYDLTGAEVTLTRGEDDDRPTWSGWWPGLDPDDARSRTRGSAEHQRGFEALERPGRLALRTLVVRPEGAAKLRVEASRPFTATRDGEEFMSAPADRGGQAAEMDVADAQAPVELVVSLATGGDGPPPRVRVASRADAQAKPVPLPPTRLLVPWAPEPPPSATTAPGAAPKLTGGDRARGEVIFASDEAKCSHCHKVRGRGGEIGPDLSDLVGRDPAQVYHDINEPSATIRPEYVAYTVAMKDGRVAMGVVRAAGADSIRVLDTNAKETLIRRPEIEELRPSRSSIMPPGLVGALGEERLRDLLAFLTQPPPDPPAKDR